MFSYQRLRDLFQLFTFSLLEHGVALLGPLDVPAHGQHTLQRLPHWPTVGLSLLDESKQPSVQACTLSESDYHYLFNYKELQNYDLVEQWFRFLDTGTQMQIL